MGLGVHIINLSRNLATMKSIVLITGLASIASQVAAHYTFPTLVVGGTPAADWQYVRMTDNHYDHNPVTDVTSSQMRCYENSTASATSTATVAAGSTIGFIANSALYHVGYLDIYLSKVNSASDESAGSGASWFKIYELAPTFVNSATGFTFPSLNLQTINFPIPKQTPSGQYLVRIEHIALHVAGTFGGAQFYIACGQIQVTGGGSGTPGPLVAFPGAYTGREQGILINVYAPYPTPYYTAPGAPIWPPVSGSPSTVSKSTSSYTPVKPSTTATTSTKPATSPTPTGSVPLYGQCGGEGYTGPTVCASGKCVASSAFWSQCSP